MAKTWDLMSKAERNATGKTKKEYNAANGFGVQGQRMAGDAVVDAAGPDPLQSKYSEMSDEYKANNAKADHKQARKDAGTYTNNRLESYKVDNINDFDPTKTGRGYKQGENRLNVTELNKLSDQFGQQAAYDFATSGKGSDSKKGNKAQALLDGWKGELRAPQEQQPVNNVTPAVEPPNESAPPNPNVPEQNAGGGVESLQAVDYKDPGYSQNFAARYGAINNQLQSPAPNYGAANVNMRQQLGVGADLVGLDKRIQQRPLYSGARSEVISSDLYGDMKNYKPPTWESGLGTGKAPDDPNLDDMYEGILDDIKDVY